MSGPRAVTLPDGTDLTDRRVQARVEAIVSRRYGPHAVVMWPRYPDVEDGVDPMIPVVDARPGATTVTLGAGVKPTDAPRLVVHGEKHGLGDLVEYDAYRARATFAHLDPDARLVRDRIAEHLRCPPHEVEVAVWHATDDHGEQRLDQIVVLRVPAVHVSPEKRRETWGNIVRSLPGGSAGWEVVEDQGGPVRLRYGRPRVLPARVDLADMLPAALDTSTWWRLPLGVTPEGNVAALDLRAGPHALLVGPTGSGKSVALRQHAASALAHGHDLVIVDVIKGGVDFAVFRPWCRAFANGTYDNARRIIETVYAEGQRRREVLRTYEAPSWVDLPVDVRRGENIRPLTVVIDEFMSTCLPAPVPKGLDKDHPLVAEATRMNSDKAVILALVGKIARELRFVGIHLAIAMQRPDASALPGFGEIRSNLTSAVQLVKPGSLPKQETLGMVFPGEQTQVAYQTIVDLDDGRTLGTALIGAEGGDVAGFRVGFAEPRRIRELLTELDVPEATPWVIPDRDDDEGGDPFTPIDGGPRGGEPQVRDLGEVELSLDDLEALADDEPAPGPASSGLDDFTDDDLAPRQTVPDVGEDDEFPAPPKPKVKVDLSDLW